MKPKNLKPQVPGAAASTVTPESAAPAAATSPAASSAAAAGAPAAVVDAQDSNAPAVLLGSDVHQSSFEILGKVYALGEIVDLAAKASGLSAEDWNALSPDERHARIDSELVKLEGAGTPSVHDDPEIPVTEESVNAARLILLAHARGESHADPFETVTAEQFAAEYFPDRAAPASAAAPIAQESPNPAPKPLPTDRLPEPHEVDARAITRPVMTTKGIVVPAPKA